MENIFIESTWEWAASSAVELAVVFAWISTLVETCCIGKKTAT